MKSLQMTYSIPRYVLSKAMGRLYAGIFTSPLAMLQYADVPEPPLPAADWARVKVRYGGICGSDLHAVYLETSPSLSPFVSFPFTVGHEIIGTVAELGQRVSGFKVGDRVAVDPILGCVPRHVAQPCRFCQQGRYSLCENFTRGDLPAGIEAGNCRAVGGGWGESVLAHCSQLFSIPPHVSDEGAALVEPLTVGLHAVKRRFPLDEERVIIVGMGTAGLCVLAALRALGSRSHVIALYRYDFQGELARRLGADKVIRVRGSEHYQAVADAIGATLHQPILGKPVLVGGAEVVYECVGTGGSIDDALRFARGGGSVVLVGLASVPTGVDWTPIWMKELTIAGTMCQSTETHDGRPVRTFQLALDLMAAGKVDLASLLTHRFRLEDYRNAISTVRGKGRHKVVKAVFDFG